MKLKKGMWRSRMCGTKKPYHTPEEAKLASQIATRKSGERIGHFKCEWCHYFHIGHTPYRIQKFIDGKA